MKKVIELFENYGFTVEPLGEKGMSFIATDERFCIPVTVVTKGGVPEISGVSFKVTDKETLLTNYSDFIDIIGVLVFKDYMDLKLRNVTPLDGMCGHGMSMFSVLGFTKTAQRRRS